MTNVYHSGTTPSDIMIVGESPGRIEASVGLPFVGASGSILSMILSHCGNNPPYHRAGCYITNLRKEYIEGNPNPTNEEIMEWTSLLRDEVTQCQPKIIICAGRFAAWWFLGGWHKWGMRVIHGRPCHGGELVDSEFSLYPEANIGYEINTAYGVEDSFELALRRDYEQRACGAIVIPCFHPANALPDRDPKGDMMGVVWKDFHTAIRVYERLLDGVEPVIPSDNIVENYGDATGLGVSDYIETYLGSPIAIDTEDNNDGSPWSVQISSRPGDGLMLRTSQSDCQLGISAIQRAMDNGTLIILHFAFHDLPVLRALGLNVDNINLIDTSYMLYLLNEPQGLKSAQWRHCGMISSTYLSIIGNIARSQQIKYLVDVEVNQYPKPTKQEILLNNGTTVAYSPRSLSTKAKRILEKITNGGDVDIWKSWHTIGGDSSGKKRISKQLARDVVDDLGPMSRGSLADVWDKDKDRAKRYACRDPDATLRVYLATILKLIEMGLA